MINKEFILNIDGLSLYSLYANACLGLRHPQNKGASRNIAVSAIKSIGQYLVDNGIITAQARKAHEMGLHH